MSTVFFKYDKTLFLYVLLNAALNKLIKLKTETGESKHDTTRSKPITGHWRRLDRNLKTSTHGRIKVHTIAL